MKIEKINDVLEVISDHSDQMQQITEALSRPIGAAAELDDELLTFAAVLLPLP